MIKSFINAAIKKVESRLLAKQDAKLDRMMAANGRLLALEHSALSPIETLSEAGFCVFSQWDEDGVIQWLVRRIKKIPHSFVEFGVQNYKEANTRFLLINDNWRGLVIDASEDHIASIRAQDIYWRHDLNAVCALVTAENINGLLRDNGADQQLGILSIDVDGNDYWIWRAIEGFSPAIVICEYNAVLGDRLALTIPYDPGFRRAKAHYSNLYFGASIAALELLAKEKGYVLVGSNLAGNNAFFVRKDFYCWFAGELQNSSPRPSLFGESRDENGGLTFKRGFDRIKAIGHLQIQRLDNGKIVKLESMAGQLYSQEWLGRMGMAK